MRFAQKGRELLELSPEESPSGGCRLPEGVPHQAVTVPAGALGDALPSLANAINCVRDD